MTSGATAIVATYGDLSYWENLAKVACASVNGQSVQTQLIRIHADSLAEARNNAARAAETEWLCFLDADDTLDPYYVENMLATHGDIRRPSTLGVYPDGTEDDYPVMIKRADIRFTNFIVIGAFVRRDMFLSVGGFRDVPILEDWDLWIRCVQQGASVVDVPDAVYRVTVRPNSRNQNHDLHKKVYSDIRRRYFSS